MRFAYADPPYPGQAHRYPENSEVDYQRLIDRLEQEFKGWALSLGSKDLQYVLPHCPETVRVAAWVKPWCPFPRWGARIAYAWEPVIVQGGRKGGRHLLKGERPIFDWVSANATRQRGVVGAKPDEFCFWIFRLLGARVGDEFADLYPGSGAVSRAWEAYCRQLSLPLSGVAS